MKETIGLIGVFAGFIVCVLSVPLLVGMPLWLATTVSPWWLLLYVLSGAIFRLVLDAWRELASCLS